MYYLFGKEGQELSVNTEKTFSDAELVNCIQVETLPEKPVEKENSRLALVNKNGVATWEYIDTTDIVAKQIQEAIDAYTLQLMEEGVM